jgi:hypothetical protein
MAVPIILSFRPLRPRLSLAKSAPSEVNVFCYVTRSSCLTIALLLAMTATGEEGRTTTNTSASKFSFVCPDVLLRSCCCIYCPKPMPCIPCPCCCCPDDYCCKPCPCIACYRGGVCSTYCGKPCPPFCRPIAADYYTCEAGSAHSECDPNCQPSSPNQGSVTIPTEISTSEESPIEQEIEEAQASNKRTY